MADKVSALTVVELNHIALYVRDLEASVTFYGDVLDLPPLPRPAFGLAGAWFALGSQQLHLNVDTQNRVEDTDKYKAAKAPRTEIHGFRSLKGEHCRRQTISLAASVKQPVE